MAYSATLANSRGLLSDEEHMRMLNLFSRAGLSMDHPQFDEDILDQGTKAILKTRDGKLRAAVPHPIGKCVFINDIEVKEMNEVLRQHKQIMKQFPRDGAGLEAFVDASDTGYTENNIDEAKAIKDATKSAGSLNGANGITNGSIKTQANGHADGLSNGFEPGTNDKLDAVIDAEKHGLDGANGVNGVNGLADAIEVRA